jgi:hypothetical protein
MEFGAMKFQQGAIRVAEADFAGKSGDFGIVGGNIGGWWPLPYGVFAVNKCGAQVRKCKISKSPYLKKPLSSNKTYNHPIIYNQVPERYWYFVLDYLTILKRPSITHKTIQPRPSSINKTLIDCCLYLNAIMIDDLECSLR